MTPDRQIEAENARFHAAEWRELQSRSGAQRLADWKVNWMIAQTILPQLYVVIDDLLDAVGEQNVDKELLIRAKKLLPDWAPHSLAQTPIQGKKRQ